MAVLSRFSMQSCSWNPAANLISLNSSLTLILSLSLLQDRIYWTDRDRAAVFMANRLSGQDIQILAENLNDPHDIVVFHQLRQPQGASSPSVAAAFCFPLVAAGMASPPQLMNEPWRGFSRTSVTWAPPRWLGPSLPPCKWGMNGALNHGCGCCVLPFAWVPRYISVSSISTAHSPVCISISRCGQSVFYRSVLLPY